MPVDVHFAAAKVQQFCCCVMQYHSVKKILIIICCDIMQATNQSTDEFSVVWYEDIFRINPEMRSITAGHFNSFRKKAATSVTTDQATISLQTGRFRTGNALVDLIKNVFGIGIIH